MNKKTEKEQTREKIRRMVKKIEEEKRKGQDAYTHDT